MARVVMVVRERYYIDEFSKTRVDSRSSEVLQGPKPLVQLIYIEDFRSAIALQTFQAKTPHPSAHCHRRSDHAQMRRQYL